MKMRMEAYLYVNFVQESLEAAERGWTKAIGPNIATDQAKEAIPKIACIILKHMLDES